MSVEERLGWRDRLQDVLTDIVAIVVLLAFASWVVFILWQSFSGGPSNWGLLANVIVGTLLLVGVVLVPVLLFGVVGGLVSLIWWLVAGKWPPWSDG